jgi:hypothetical protein
MAQSLKAKTGMMDEHRPDDEQGEGGGSLPARFERFERVRITDKAGKSYEGTVLWRDLVQYSQFAPIGFRGTPRRWSQWEYAVSLPDFASCPTFEESRLQPTGEFDPEEAHLGKRFEISFDTGLGEDMRTVEGSYRVPGQFWQIFLFIKGDAQGRPVPELRHRSVAWPSEITGLEFHVPEEALLDREYMIQALAGVFGTDDWVVVRGPDSRLMK